MSRAARLLDLLAALRRRRRPVAAAVLAAELGVTPRTIYRDVATLVAGGATIEGEAGIGYVLRPGTFLPPLMFSATEADAVMLGLSLVAARGDEELAEAAAEATAKIAAVLPPERGDAGDGLLAPNRAAGNPVLRVLRHALRAEHAVRLRYVYKNSRATEREVWPVAVGFFEAAEVLAAWCTARHDFRHFRLDRIAEATSTGRRFPARRRVLLAQWRAAEGIDC